MDRITAINEILDLEYQLDDFDFEEERHRRIERSQSELILAKLTNKELRLWLKLSRKANGKS